MEKINDLCFTLFGRIPDSFERCSVGMVNTVYILYIGDKQYILRLNSENGAYRDSARLLEDAEKVGLPVPHVIAKGCFESYEYLVLTYIEGRDLGLVYNDLSREDKQRIASQTVRLQQLAAGLRCEKKCNPWYDFIDKMLDCAEERITENGFFDSEKVMRIKHQKEHLKSYFEELEPVAYLDDISTKNLLIDEGNVSGVIDIDEIGWGDPLTYIALTRTALLGMGCDDDICEMLLDAMDANDAQRRAEAFYSLLYCVDLMSERGMVFNGKRVKVDDEVITRFNRIYDVFWERWTEKKA